ncbi:MAG: NERD domain-containing protein/DEAD/DEAH box helicase [Chloroflexota bacterium]|jgi:superfamily I DNA/RNA helicase
MAKMFPTPIRPDTQSRAEFILYDAFRDNLPDSYHVFHSVAWQARSGRYYERDGEADFVIIHPEKGILVIEAKAGQIAYDGTAGIWIQNNHLMKKDPFEQAKGSRYHLKRTLQEEPYWRQRNIAYGHAVAFPDVVAPPTPLNLQAPSTVILDKRALQDVEAWMDDVFFYYCGRDHRDDIDGYGMKYLIDLLAPVRQLRSLLGLDFQDEEAEFIELTAAQYRLLDFLANTRRAAIAGCAGSGKTLLAAEKARRLAAQGWQVLLTCYNRNLATFLSEDYLADRPKTLEIANFHKMADDFVQRSGQSKPADFNQNMNQYFKEVLPEQVMTAVDILGPQYDAIVVDEAQDFQENWWLPLQMLLDDPDEGTFYIFYDDNQNIYGGLRRIKNLAQYYPLIENFRNTQAINDMVTRFYKSDHEIVALGPPGRKVEVHPFTDDNGMLKALRQTLHRLVNEEEIDPEDIVVLTPRSEAKSALSQAGRLGSFHLTHDWDADHDKIFYETIHSFKGLESPVIILTELTEDLHHAVDELLYVGCSRAKHHLVIVCQEAIQDRFTVGENE